jgi:hypothetical protein
MPGSSDGTIQHSNAEQQDALLLLLADNCEHGINIRVP